MKNVRSGTDIVRLTELSRIIKVLKNGHPHVAGQTFVRKLVERHRIEHALRMEAPRLSYCLVARMRADGTPRCGVLVATPRAGAGDMFETYGDAPMFFGFLFGFESSDDFRTVFEEVLTLASEGKRARLFGPVEITINYSIGLAEAPSPFPPSFLMPENPVEWNGWFEDFGFQVAQRLFTYEIEYASVDFAKFHERDTPLSSLRLDAIVPPFTEAQRQAIVDVFNSGWAENWGFVKIDAAGVENLEREFKPLLWGGLAYIAWLNGKAAAIAVSIPDINEIFRAASVPGIIARAWRMLVRKKARTMKILILGVSRELHGSGLGVAIIERVLDAGRAVAERHGVTHVQMGWVLESNRPVNRLIAAWAPGAKRAAHRVWRYDLRLPPE